MNERACWRSWQKLTKLKQPWHMLTKAKMWKLFLWNYNDNKNRVMLSFIIWIWQTLIGQIHDDKWTRKTWKHSACSCKPEPTFSQIWSFDIQYLQIWDSLGRGHSCDAAVRVGQGMVATARPGGGVQVHYIYLRLTSHTRNTEIIVQITFQYAHLIRRHFIRSNPTTTTYGLQL